MRKTELAGECGSRGSFGRGETAFVEAIGGGLPAWASSERYRYEAIRARSGNGARRGYLQLRMIRDAISEKSSKNSPLVYGHAVYVMTRFFEGTTMMR